MSSRILVMMSGSIAAYKMCHVLSRLKQQGHEIEVVASPWVLKFVGEATIEGLTGRPVRKAMFGTGAHMGHINLIRWADLAILAPATANSINKLSQGLGDDLITTLFLAHDFKKPWLIAPAMNTKMYHHPVTRASVEKLKSMGCEILETASGVLACGEIGDGKLLDSELLLAEILRRLPAVPNEQSANAASEVPSSPSRQPGRARHILITSGGTTEPIDPVRSITNTSTGRTGALIAEFILGAGHRVTFLAAQHSVQPAVEEIGASESFSNLTFTTYKDLSQKLQSVLKEHSFDAVIHAAAVSDYSLKDGPSISKMESSDELVLNLKKNPKLLPRLKEWSKNPLIKTIAFKLTATKDLADRKLRLEKLLQESKPDYVVTNDISDPSTWQLHKADGEVAGKVASKVVIESALREELAPALEGVL